VPDPSTDESIRRKEHKLMVSKGLIVRLEARAGKEEELASFLTGALPLVQDEPETLAWFALRFGASSFAIVDAFPDEAGRQAHLDGAVAAALLGRADELLAEPPEIQQVDVLAAKLSPPGERP
jgi:quinol monooxygenase YgiN